MAPDFEVHMVSVTWSSQHVVEEFKLGVVPLEKTNSGPLSEEYETIVYTKQETKFCQIAIKSAYEVRQQGSVELLYRIPDTDVWIIKQDWRKGRSGKFYHYCPSINTVGTIFLNVADRTVLIKVSHSIPNFDFDQLKDDFSGEFWHLLASAHSGVHTARKTGQARLPITELVRSFLNSFEQIVKHPKKELRQIVRERPIQEVKPVAKTYQKLAVNGLNTAISLPSKAYIENIDLYENRYVCQMLSDIKKIVHHTEVYHEQRVKRLSNERSYAEEAISDLDKPEIVDPAQIQEELNQKHNAVQELEAKWEAINRDVYSAMKYRPIDGIVTIKYAKDDNSFFCTYNNNFCVISFPSEMASKMQQGLTYSFSFCIKKQDDKYVSKAGKSFDVFNAYSIHKVVCSETESANALLRRATFNYDTLYKNAWRADSIQSDFEKKKNAEDRLSQKNTLQKKIKKLNGDIETCQSALKNSNYIHENTQNILRSEFFKQVHKQKSIKFRPSMTFIQNTHYKNVYQTYLKIKDAIGIDSDTLDLFEKLEIYTIRELPQVYELWCLIAIMRLLEDFWGFKPNRKDLIKLLASISPSEKKIERSVKISLHGDLAGRRVNLYYQKQYKNSLKRPDILLEIQHNARVIYLILDAKCKNYDTLAAAESDMNEMVEKYRESQKNRFIFTIHPRLKESKKNASLTNFGGKPVYRGDTPYYLFHESGYLAAQPGKIDNLRKSIAMGFEYLLEADHSAQKDDSIDPKPEFDLICMNCGGVDFECKKTTREGKLPNCKTRFTYNYKCNNLTCGHFVSINYCWNCKTKLFKHGRYWDYHRTSVYSAMDIHCPNCGMTTADRS